MHGSDRVPDLDNDCERARGSIGISSTKAKWRSTLSACRGVLEKCLTAPTFVGRRCFAKNRRSQRDGNHPKDLRKANETSEGMESKEQSGARSLPTKDVPLEIETDAPSSQCHQRHVAVHFREKPRRRVSQQYCTPLQVGSAIALIDPGGVAGGRSWCVAIYQQLRRHALRR